MRGRLLAIPSRRAGEVGRLGPLRAVAGAKHSRSGRIVPLLHQARAAKPGHRKRLLHRKGRVSNPASESGVAAVGASGAGVVRAAAIRAAVAGPHPEFEYGSGGEAR